MSAEIIQFAEAKSGKRVFAFHEACPVCNVMVKPFVVAGRATDRFRCEGAGSYIGAHEPYHWIAGDHDVEWGSFKPGYDIPTAIKKRTLAQSAPDAI
jgi:hypothetical protein